MKEIAISKGLAVFVDDEDFEVLSKWSWSAKKSPYTYYAVRAQVINGKSTEISMHRQILGVEFDLSNLVDHKDGNGLNNQKENLRKCSRSLKR